MGPGLSGTSDLATRKTILYPLTLPHAYFSPNLTELQATIMVLVQQPEEVQLADLHGAHRLLLLFSGQDLAAL